jgi:membrane fusion protein, copper/silver efflux system
LQQVAVSAVAGDAGKKLELLYGAYFDVQQALASDKKPTADSAQTLHKAALELGSDSSLPAASAKLAEEIATKSEHLHHLDLIGVRREFKPISHAIVKLAAQIRGAGARHAFTHFYCSMVKGGGGDWLQANDQLLNPYFGSEMLHCGEKVQEFPPSGKPAIKAAPQPKHDVPASGEKGA